MVPYCYLFLLSVFILWFSYYVSDIFCAFRKLLSVYVFSYFPFGFDGRMWDLIVSVPDHCLSFYFELQPFYSKCQPAKYLTVKQFKPSVKR